MSLKHIVEYENAGYSDVDKELAHIVLSAIEDRPDIQDEHFRIHSKGLGVRCLRRDGIKANEFVTEYFGEIYPSWRWYEKEDVIKHGQNSKKLSKELPDFYNIIFERHADDPEGYNWLTIDPILKGSFASRLSHSCFPNWATVIHIKDGKYSIGMFATRDIRYGEELSFDYKSVTESDKEFLSAIWLWGSFKCTGRFLSLSHSKKFMATLKDHHTFIDRNYLIWYACTNPDITEEDHQILIRHGIKSSLITKDVPDWLTKWTSLVLRFWEFEVKSIKKFLKEYYPNYTDLQCDLEAKNILSNRISNIAISLDKVKHWLKLMDTKEPPLRTLTFREVFRKFWEDQGSFKSSLFNMLEKLEDWEVKHQCLKMFWDACAISITELMDDSQCKIQFKSILAILKDLSIELRKIKSKVIFTDALADTLYLYWHTETYFTPTDNYKRFSSEEVCVRKCEVTCDPRNRESKMNPFASEEERIVYKDCKDYDPTYIWGQLTGWYKQSVDKPNASLSADRRGTLSYPDLESFDLQKPLKKSKRPRQKNKNNEYSYNADEASEEDIGRKRRKRSKSKKSAMSANDASVMGEEIKQDFNGEEYKTSNPYLGDDLPQIQITDVNDEMSEYEDIYSYPNKKFSKRNEFLANWKENFSKQWDPVWKWHYRNKQKMFGSVQFDSLIKSGLGFDEDRLSYFHQVVDDLLSFK